MKIRMTQVRQSPRFGLLEIGTEYTLPAAVARQLVNQGFAVEATEEPAKHKSKET